jgi:hypothetical protein
MKPGTAELMTPSLHHQPTAGKAKQKSEKSKECDV